MIFLKKNRTELLDNIIAVQQLDVSGKILYVNRAFCNMHRQTRKNLKEFLYGILWQIALNDRISFLY